MKNKDEKLKSVWLENIPNLLTISRIILTFVIIYLLFTNASLVTIIIIFAIAALTDFFDGQLARRFNWTSEFGRKADMIADRFLWAGTAIAFIIVFSRQNLLGWNEGIQILLIMSREIISSPFALLAFFSRKHIPHARTVGKWTTLLQGFALPALILSVKYPLWLEVSWPLAILTGIIGSISALYYIHDIQKEELKKGG